MSKHVIVAGRKRSDRHHPHALYVDGQLAATRDAVHELEQACGDNEWVERSDETINHVLEFGAELKSDEPAETHQQEAAKTPQQKAAETRAANKARAEAAAEVDGIEPAPDNESED